MARQFLSVAALAMLVIGPQHSITAKPTSNIIDLGSLSRGQSSASGINNDAAQIEVVGFSMTAKGVVHGFFWTTPGPMVDLGGLEGCESFARDINNHRQIAGVSTDRSSVRWAVVWTNVDTRWNLEKLPTLIGRGFDDALGINNGIGGDPATVDVVGVSYNRAVAWAKSATGWTVRDLGTLPGDMHSHASDVNDHGDIVGASSNSATGVVNAVLWTSVGVMRLPPLAPDSYTTADAISNGGDVVGTSTDAYGNRHAVRWRNATGWRIEDLGTLGGCCSSGHGVNTLGDVVGMTNFSEQPYGSQHAFLVNSMGMSDLGSIQGSSRAWDVNDFGTVVGEGDVGRTSHALLWRVP
jgi:probable HAF family extracellular repeat protein